MKRAIAWVPVALGLTLLRCSAESATGSSPSDDAGSVGNGDDAGPRATGGGGAGGAGAGGNRGGGPSGGGGLGGGAGGSAGATSDAAGVDSRELEGDASAIVAGNPFEGASLYVNPDYAATVQSVIDANPDKATAMERVKGTATAIWLDKAAKTADIGRYLDDALSQQDQSGAPVVAMFVVYDLPDRDCAANASNGEFSAANGGLDQYKTTYVDVIAKAFHDHPRQRIVAVIEPDSLPNIATNLGVAKCAAAEQVYRDGVAYAVATLAAPNVYQYLDAAHSGWLGWDDNRSKVATVYKQVLDAAGGVDKIRGFSTNVSNYTVLHEGPELFDYQGNPCHDELTFASKLRDNLSAAGVTHNDIIIDTSRNGRGGIRHQWGSWCNVKGAGLGERPVASPAAGIDAYVWIKPPGESDGTSDSSAPRYDSMCGNEDATSSAPQAGTWFGAYFGGLVTNASPSL